ncbi:MAG: hypothetical protein V4501_03095 [Pseudomonadota bacterium]
MRSNRSRRIFQETSEQPVWYLQLWQSLSVDVSSDEGIISTIDKSGLLRTITSTIMPVIATVLLIAPIVNTWLAIKNFYYAENKNLDKTLDLLVNILMTVTSVGVMATLLAGVVYISPYILLVAMGVGLGYGIYNVVKHLYAAWCANEEGDEARAKQHLWTVPYHAILTVLSGLGLLVQLNYAFNVVVINGIFKIVNISNSAYNVAQILLYSLGFLITLSSMPAFAKMVMEYNAKTWKVLANPLANLNELIFGKEGPEAHVDGLWDRIQKGYEFCKEQPLKATLLFIPTVIKLSIEAIGFLAVIGARGVALALAPIQFIGVGVTKAINFIRHIITPAPQIANLDLAQDPISIEQKNSTARVMRNMLITKHARLTADIAAEIAHLKTQEDTPKIRAKFVLMRELELKLGKDIASYDANSSLDTLREEAKEYSPRLYQSFFRLEGHVEKIDRQFEELDMGIKEARALAYDRAPNDEVKEDKSELEIVRVNGHRAA